MERIRPVACSAFQVSGCKLTSLFLGIAMVFFLVGGGVAQETLLKVRKPVFAGSFYPSDPASLDRMVESCLKETASKGTKISSHIFGLVAPHAGYEYSGLVAASAYNQIRGKEYTTVILIGSSHRVPFRGISIYPAGQWETPLGRVAVDSDMARLLQEKCKSIRSFPPAFEKEHSLEVQLPFLQKTLKTFKIVPLITGSMEAEDRSSLSEALLVLAKQNPRTLLIVASSDMSHFHNYAEAKQMDGLTLKNIERMDIEKVLDGLRKGEAEMCGDQGVVTLMMTARKLGAETKVLTYANSGDVTRDRNRVVGYGAVAFSYQDVTQGLNRKEQSILLTLARRTLNDYISTRSAPPMEVNEPRLLEKRGAFVTLTKDGQLRGCIGYFTPVAPLHRAILEMTINASTKDPRFPPVSKDELKDIHIEISVLTPLQQVNNVEEIEVGRHGLFITKGNNSGLLLPQVAAEYGWNREEFLRQTCRKAGLSPGAWQEKGTQLYLFSAQIFSE